MTAVERECRIISTRALHKLLTAEDHATHATMQQILICHKCSRDIMIIVAGEAAKAVASMLTGKMNNVPLLG